jgi:hypothetical protein
LVAGGIPSLLGTCGTWHDTPNVGNHSFPTPLNIGNFYNSRFNLNLSEQDKDDLVAFLKTI